MKLSKTVLGTVIICAFLFLVLGVFGSLFLATDREEFVAQRPEPMAPEYSELAFWEAIQDSEDPDMYRVYLEQYPEGNFAALARSRLEGLAAPSESSFPQPKPSITPAQLIVPYNFLGGMVYIDGRPVGPVCPTVHALSPGKHTVRVEKEGYAPFETRITLAARDEIVVRARLGGVDGTSRGSGISRRGSGISRVFIEDPTENEDPTDEDPTEEPSTITLSRYPTVESPDKVEMEREFSVEVSLTENLITPEVKPTAFDEKRVKVEPDGKLSIQLPDQEEWKIDVALSALGFEYLNKDVLSVTLYKSGDSTKAIFRLRARKIHGPQRDGQLYVTFLHRGALLAEVTRDIKIINPKMSESIVTVPAPKAASAKVPVDRKPVSIGSDDSEESPDLAVFILSDDIILSDGKRRYKTQVTISSPHFSYLENFVLKEAYPEPELTTWLGSKYAKFSGYSVRGVALALIDKSDAPSLNEEAVSMMRGVGKKLYRKFAPAVFKKAFWELVGKRGEDFRSIQIITNNPRLPWELMIPYCDKETLSIVPDCDDKTDEPDFLGLKYRIARWHRPHPPLAFPPQSLPLENLMVIAPKYKGQNKLPWQPKEIEALKGKKGYRRIDGQFGAIKTLFRDPPSGIIHFSGHGLVKESTEGVHEYFIRLENNKELDLDAWEGLLPGQVRTHPFFFFNACEVGQSHRVANIVDGWAIAMLETGASGYIGPLWPIGDKGAADFGVYFYESLYRELKENATVTVSSILRETRKRFRETGDPTYLSYIFYGDPHFRFER
uniref:PEGA domain-containing protein n=1 Tax=Candidatus Kentrum sp. TUN TaxID=2126343 RepID=A0A450Z960_9GAMM|nr:MAG: PEGA domain-containing protein [Candidatus Kentron sp. TUN]VFK51502.1 MAG: PEGA domain-containing protein [Candidatus Kentron sp. TUN]